MGERVEEIRAVRNTAIGINMAGQGLIIRNNHIVFTGQSTISPEAIAISVSGTGIRVINNDIMTARQPAGDGRGIRIVTGGGVGSPGNLAINNRITDADEGIRFFESGGKFRDNLTSGVAVPYIYRRD